MKEPTDSTSGILKKLTKSSSPLQFSKRGRLYREFSSQEELDAYKEVDKSVEIETTPKGSELTAQDSATFVQNSDIDEFSLEEKYMVMSSQWQGCLAPSTKKQKNDKPDVLAQKEDSEEEVLEKTAAVEPKPWVFGEALEPSQEKVDEYRNKGTQTAVSFPLLNI